MIQIYNIISDIILSKYIICPRYPLLNCCCNIVWYGFPDEINQLTLMTLFLGKLSMSKNYCEICGLDTDVNCLKSWLSKEKPFDQERKHLACILQVQ